MRFLHYHFLFILLLLPLLWGIKLRKDRKNKTTDAINFTNRHWNILEKNKIENKKLFYFSRLIKTLVFILLVIALSRPQEIKKSIETETNARDIILTLDLSGSMEALDFFIDHQRVSRLDALKKVVKEFIEKRKGDRIGLVVFGENAFTRSPLTRDTLALQSFVDGLEVGMAGDSTSIGEGIAVSLKKLNEIDQNSKVIILVTDGKNQSGNVSPLEAAKVAKEMGVKIHCIGIGQSGKAPFPVKDQFGRDRIAYYNFDYDGETLKKIAEETKSYYFNAKDTESLENVYSEIDKLETRTSSERQFVDITEKYDLFLEIALYLLIFHEFFSTFFLLSVPFKDF